MPEPAENVHTQVVVHFVKSLITCGSDVCFAPTVLT